MEQNILEKYKGITGYALFVEGQIVKIIDELTGALRAQYSTELFEQLEVALKYINNIVPEILISDTVKYKGKKEYRYSKIIISYLVNFYRNGILCGNNRWLIPPNDALSNYYLYILFRRISTDKIFKSYEYNEEENVMEHYYNSNTEKIEHDYFKTIVERYKKQYSRAKLSKKTELERRYLASLGYIMKSKNEYIQLISTLESLKFGEYAINSQKTNLEIFESIVNNNLSQGKAINPNIQKILAEYLSRGVFCNTGTYIIEPNPDIAKKFGTCMSGQKYSEKRKGKTYVCSDIHGQFNVYRRIVDFLKPEDTLYIIGDVIDKGPDGIKILQDLIHGHNGKNIQFIMGNHEYMMFFALVLNIGLDNWISGNNGGKSTYTDYLNLSKKDQKAIINFLYNAIVVKNISINNQRFQLVHANRCIDFHSECICLKDIIISKDKNRIRELEDMLSSRAYDTINENAFVVVGHTPNKCNKIEINDKYIKIDCGLATRNNGNLCLFCLDNMKHIYFSNRDQDYDERA